MVIGSHSLTVEVGAASGAVGAQGAGLAGGVRADEDPVLPGGEPSEDLGLEGLRADEAIVRLQARARVGAEAAPLLHGDAHLFVPVDVVGGEGDQAEAL